MATHSRVKGALDYPTSDGKPMAETEVHRDDMMDLIQTIQHHFADDDMTCVSGNMLMFYEEGNRRKHVSPDVFVTRGIPRQVRDNYLVWVEGKGPDLVIELTSKSTRREDQGKKLELYRDILHVAEYFLFDPYAEYLRPPFQGYRLIDGDYRPIEPINGRLPSEILGLHLERLGAELRLVNPNTGQRLLTREERIIQAQAAQERAEAERPNFEIVRQLIEDTRQQYLIARDQAEMARQQAEDVIRQSNAERLAERSEMEQLRRQVAELLKSSQNPQASKE